MHPMLTSKCGQIVNRNGKIRKKIKFVSKQFEMFTKIKLSEYFYIVFQRTNSKISQIMFRFLFLLTAHLVNIGSFGIIRLKFEEKNYFRRP